MKTNLKVWYDGKLIPWNKAGVHLLSHGFSRGSAIFEVFGIHPGPKGPAIFRMQDHLQRLKHSADALGMEMAFTPDEIADAVVKTAKANRIRRGVVKIMAFWSEESLIELVLHSKLDVAVLTVPETSDLHLDDTKPISACLSKWRKLHPDTAPVTAKACANYLNAYLVRKDALERGFDVGLLLGLDGNLTEGALEAVFLVKNGVLMTTPEGKILDSISRKTVLELAPVLNIPVEIREMKAEALDQADEIFTSHTGTKVSPVGRYENRTLEAPGPVTRKLMDLMDNILHFRDERFMHWFQVIR